MWGEHLAEAVKDLVEEAQHMATRRLGQVVQGLARKVANLAVLVGDARQDRRDEHRQVGAPILPCARRGPTQGRGVSLGWRDGATPCDRAPTWPSATATAARPIRPPLRLLLLIEYAKSSTRSLITAWMCAWSLLLRSSRTILHGPPAAQQA